MQLTKLRIALDSETTSHADLLNSKHHPHEEKDKEKAQRHQATDKIKTTMILAQSEERVQALSVIMLFLCTGLQYAQGVALH